jgi:thiamine-phosphate pyrophosphorylase
LSARSFVVSTTGKLPPLYPILDAGLLAQANISIETFARELHQAGIRFLQYRDKDASDALFLERAALLRKLFSPSDSCLILNDRVPLLGISGFDGIHVGQLDLSPAEVRASLGQAVFVGVSTHTEKELRMAEQGPANYIAIGPVFATSSKQVPDPVVGLDGVRLARRITTKPVVAIGGINRFNCASVIEAGADSVAVISDLLPTSTSTTANGVEAFLTNLR